MDSHARHTKHSVRDRIGSRLPKNWPIRPKQNRRRRATLVGMLFPSASARALLEGLAACGVPLERIVSRDSFAIDDLNRHDGVVDRGMIERVWAAALQASPRATMPLEVGLRVPFG